LLVLGVGRVHEVDTRSRVGASDQLQRERVARGGDTVGTSVVSAIERAVLGAARRVRAVGGAPLIAVVAVGVARGGVQPAPVGIEHNRVLLRGARAASGTLAHGELGVNLGGVGADLLGVDTSAEGERG